MCDVFFVGCVYGVGLVVMVGWVDGWGSEFVEIVEWCCVIEGCDFVDWYVGSGCGCFW